MAPPVSILNFTSRLLSLLDLNEEQQKMQNIEDMDITEVVDVPDTPDRMAVRKINDGGDIEREVTSSVACDSEKSDLSDKGVPDWPRGSGKLIAENGDNRRFFPRHFRNCDETEYGSSPIVASLDNTASAHLFRRRIAPQISKLETEPSLQPQQREHFPCSSHGHGGDRAKLGGDSSAIAEVLASDVKSQDKNSGKMIDLISSPKISAYSTHGRNTKRNMLLGNTHFDKGKGMCTEVPTRNFTCIDRNSLLNLTAQNEHTRIPETERAFRALKDFRAEEMRKGSMTANGGSPSQNVANSSKASSDDCKRKTKIVDCTYNGAAVGSDCTKSIDLSNDSQPKTKETTLRSPQSGTSLRRTGQKRLVRNGCISPYNIAKAKQTAENHGRNFTDGKQVDVGRVASNSGIPSCQTNFVLPDSEADHGDQVKGKGVMRDQNPAKEFDAKGKQISSRSSLNPIQEGYKIGDASGDAFRSFEDIGGWRSTRNRSKGTPSRLLDEGGCLIKSDQRHVNTMENRGHVGAVNKSFETDFVEVKDPVSSQHGTTLLAQVSSSVLSESDRESGRHFGANKLRKRQNKHRLTRNNLGECSTSTFDDSAIADLWLSGEPSNPRSTRSRNARCHGPLGPVIEIDELSPEIIGSDAKNTRRIVDDDSDTRARQVIADEILARQLQEQFYHEVPGAVDVEIDASVAWTLQQEEDAQHTYSGNRRASHPRNSSLSHLNRQNPSRSFPNLSVRSANRGQVPTSARMGRLRNRFLRQSPTTSTRGRSFQFPPFLDFETRNHLLEAAMEAAIGNSIDMRLAGQRDFNENDYEMLLALDEDNHQHVGASVNQINSLPQSTVQTDNFEEACAICLETPTTGDTIRHLPCLHKFHKDCIDPWLRRRTSCPVCKSSIT